MPLQNRVDPWGRLLAVPDRGAWMGNRGVLHDENQRIVAPWRHKAWITCRLEFKERKRELFSPGRYSELFFLDEATAFSAGHRPCGECRRERYKEFKAAWCAANLDEVDPRSVPVSRIDTQLHAERAARGGMKVTYAAPVGSLPPGTFIEYAGDAYLVWHGSLHSWSPAGYNSVPGSAPRATEPVTVLTPPSIVAAFRRGLSPQVHGSADG